VGGVSWCRQRTISRVESGPAGRRMNAQLAWYHVGFPGSAGLTLRCDLSRRAVAYTSSRGSSAAATVQ
jgi:hypothetical protein